MRVRPIPLAAAGAALAAILCFDACGSSTITRNDSAPTSSSDDFGADVPVRLVAHAVKPSLLHLFNGFQATFVNQDTVPRTVAFDSARSDLPACVAVAVGVLQPGERRTTEPLPRFAACYFEDGDRPADAALQGVVVTH
jgi:hypothetical protein